MTQAERDIRRKLKILNHTLETKNITETCDILESLEKPSIYGNVHTMKKAKQV